MVTPLLVLLVKADLSRDFVEKRISFAEFTWSLPILIARSSVSQLPWISLYSETMDVLANSRASFQTFFYILLLTLRWCHFIEHTSFWSQGMCDRLNCHGAALCGQEIVYSCPLLVVLNELYSQLCRWVSSRQKSEVVCFCLVWYGVKLKIWTFSVEKSFQQ